MNDAPHTPVLLAEVIAALDLQSGEICIDGTFGAGGYTRAILEGGADRVIGVDRDPDAISNGQELVEKFNGRLVLAHAPFSELDRIATEFGHDSVDAIVLDIGVSSMQLDQAERGFSFQNNGPLDMRMAQVGPSAADIVNTAEAATLAKIFWAYGEEKKSRRIATAILEQRKTEPFKTTHELANLVRETIGTGPKGKTEKHPATRVFQALRIAVNRELEELVAALFAAERILRPGGRLVVVTFHSLEDRIVKRFFRARSSARPRASRHAPDVASPDASFQIVNLPAVKAGEEEVNVNPRARSATLRAGVRMDAAAHSADLKGLGLPKVEL